MEENVIHHKWLLKTIVFIVVANVVIISVSFWMSIFGPREGIKYGVIGFAISAILNILDDNKRYNKLLTAIPDGLIHSKCRTSLQSVINHTCTILAFAVAIGFVVMFAVARLDGVSNIPVFEKLTKYELSNHGHMTEVSRYRYVTIGLSAMVVFHFFSSILSIKTLNRLLFGVSK